MQKEVKRLDRVIIRFAGDSGDGMQLTGDRFTSETASFGNDLSTLPNFPAEIRAPAGTLPGVSSFQLHFADHDILTPGDAPNVLVAMNPAALKANIADLPRGARRSSSTPTSSPSATGKVGYAASPLEDGSLDAYQRPPGAADLADGRGARRSSGSPQGRRAGEEHVRARPAVLDVPPADRGHRDVPARPSSPRSRRSPRPTWPRSGRAGTSARPPRTSRSRYEVEPARRCPPGTLPQHLREPGPVVRAGRGRRQAGAAAVPGLVPDHPGLATSCTSCPSTRTSACGPSRPRTRSPASARRSARPSAARSGVTTTSGPGVALKSETIGLAVVAGAAAAVVRHPARRPVDRAADQDRAGRPAAGDVRPQRRGAGAGRRARDAVRLLRRRAGGGPDRADLPHPGVPALRRLPGQRLRAVADPRRRPNCPTCGCEFATGPNHDAGRRHRVFWPYMRDPQTLARPWAVPGTPGLEHRIGGIEKEDGTGNISYDPANHDFMVRTRQAKIDGIARRCRRWRWTTRPATRRCWCWAGARRTARSPRPSAGCGGPAATVAQAHLRHLNPLPANLGEVLQPLRQGDRAGDEPRASSRMLLRAKYLVDVHRLQPGPRHAVQGRAAGRRSSRR